MRVLGRRITMATNGITRSLSTTPSFDTVQILPCIFCTDEALRYIDTWIPSYNIVDVQLGHCQWLMEANGLRLPSWSSMLIQCP